MSEKDPYIGETFQAKDSRTENRRVRVTGLAQSQPIVGVRYSARVVTDDGNPAAVGRSVRLLGFTLATRYRKVSH